MDVVDKIQQGDVIRFVRIWDGQTMTRRQELRELRSEKEELHAGR
jgi:hypothetical protein